MLRRAFTVAAASLLMAPAARAGSARQLVVAELFTSQGCSSCPPADALLTDLSETVPGLLALAFHVTYWDRLGWRDPFALEVATARQRRYAALLGSEGVYTPQLVVGGRIDVIRSDRQAVRRALAAAAPPVQPVRLRRDGGHAMVEAEAGNGSGTLVLVGYDPRRQTPVGRGENSGRTLTESNIVRSLSVVANWAGPAIQLRCPLPEGEQMAVLLQAPGGIILGAAREG